jgi:hypothetical protein
MYISRLSVCHDGNKDIENPEPELLEFAEQLLMEEANEQLCEAA